MAIKTVNVLGETPAQVSRTCSERYRDLERDALELTARTRLGELTAFIELELVEAKIAVYRKWSALLGGERFVGQGLWFRSSDKAADAAYAAEERS